MAEPGADRRCAASSRSVRRIDGFAHARRKFFELNEAQANPIAQEALLRIAALYEIEARGRGMSVAQRADLRQREALPLLTAMHDWLKATRQTNARRAKSLAGYWRRRVVITKRPNVQAQGRCAALSRSVPWSAVLGDDLQHPQSMSFLEDAGVGAIGTGVAPPKFVAMVFEKTGATGCAARKRKNTFFDFCELEIPRSRPP